MKKILIICLTFLTFGKVFAQDDALFTQFYANRLHFNPAATGASDMFSAAVTYRNQWAGDRSLSRLDRPSYMLFNAAQYFNSIRSGFGLTVFNARQHVQNDLRVKLSYAYHLQVDEEAWLSFGISAGLLSRGVREGLTPDGSLINRTNTMSDLGLGVEFYTPELTVGLSARHVPMIVDGNISSFRDLFSGDQGRYHVHFYFFGEYRFVIDNDWSIIPSLKLRNSSITTTADIAVRASYLNMFQLGVGVRRDAVAMLFGLSWAGFSLGYSFDIHVGTVSGLRPSHEIVLGYRVQLLRNTADTRLQRLGASADF